MRELQGPHLLWRSSSSRRQSPSHFTDWSDRDPEDTPKTFDDDVPAVFRMGRVVGHDGYMAFRNAPLFRRASRVGIWLDRPGCHDLAVLCRHDRGPVFRDRANARIASPYGRSFPVLRVDANIVRAAVWSPSGVHFVLHADAGAHEFAVFSPHGRSDKRIPWRTGARND